MIKVTPFSELEIATAKVALLQEFRNAGALPLRFELAPMRMHETLRELAILRLAHKLPPASIAYAPRDTVL